MTSRQIIKCLPNYHQTIIWSSGTLAGRRGRRPLQRSKYLAALSLSRLFLVPFFKGIKKGTCQRQWPLKKASAQQGELKVYQRQKPLKMPTTQVKWSAFYLQFHLFSAYSIA